MIRRCALFLVVVVAVACTETESTDVRAVWRWRPPPVASVGMPAADGGGIAATYGHLRLVLLDGAGRARWEAERLGLRDVAPLLLADRVLAATDNGVAAFDRGTGAVRWDVDLGDRANTPVPVGADAVAVTTWDGRLAVLDVATGAVRHVVALPGDVLGPGAAGGGVVVATWDDGLAAGVVAVDAGSGAIRWRVPVPADGVSSPAVTAGVVVVVTGDARVVGLDLGTGERRWQRSTAGAGSPEVAPFVGADVIVADRLGGLLGVRAADGSRRWGAAGRGAAVRGGPVATGGLVALPVDDGRLLVRTTGGIQLLDPPGRVSGVAAGPEGRLVVATREAAQNELVAYGGTDPGAGAGPATVQGCRGCGRAGPGGRR